MALTEEQLNAVKNKYLDGEGLAHLWEKIKAQSAKIALIGSTGSTWEEILLQESDKKDKKYIEWLLSAEQDVMIEDVSDNNRRYYYVKQEKGDYGRLDYIWESYSSSKIYRITVKGDSLALTLTKEEFPYEDQYGYAINTYVAGTYIDDNKNKIHFVDGTYNHSTNNLEVEVNNTDGTLIFNDKVGNKTLTFDTVSNSINAVNATYATKLGNATTSYSPETTLTSNSDSKIPTSKAVATYVTGKVAEIDQFKYVVSTDAATTPKDVKWEKASGQSWTTITGTLVAGASTEFIIYLVPATVGNSLLAESGSYVEYLTIKSGETYKWEQIGTTKTDLSDYQPKDADLTAIANLTGGGLLKRNSNNTWSLDTTAYAGGTAVTLNSTSKAGSTASFYAPTAAGTANQVLISNGSNKAPTWTSQGNITAGKVGKSISFTDNDWTIKDGPSYDGSEPIVVTADDVGAVPIKHTGNPYSGHIGYSGNNPLIYTSNANGDRLSLIGVSNNLISLAVGESYFKITADSITFKDNKIVDYSMTLTTGEIDIICADN